MLFWFRFKGLEVSDISSLVSGFSVVWVVDWSKIDCGNVFSLKLAFKLILVSVWDRPSFQLETGFGFETSLERLI